MPTLTNGVDMVGHSLLESRRIRKIKKQMLPTPKSIVTYLDVAKINSKRK